MSGSKLENVWQVVKNHNYDYVKEISNEMLCLLCKNVLINAHFAPCGCRFCLSCISEFLGGQNKMCLGNTEECQLEMLNLAENIFVDHPMNVKILKLKVKCPQRFCESVEELRKMEDHSRICKYRSVPSPFSNFGSDKCSKSEEKVDQMNNEIKLMKTHIFELRAENKLLRNDINKLKSNEEKRQEEIAVLQCKCDEENLKIKQLNVNMISFNTKVTYGEFIWKIEKFSEKITHAKNGINHSIYSEPFITHRNGYKMCLELHPDGSGTGTGTHLSMCFCLMKGDFDEILEWPFRHSVIFSLLNQRTHLPHVSLIAKCRDFPNYKELSQPKDRNYGMGNQLFITQKEISSNPDLANNDQIFIKCFVDIRL